MSIADTNALKKHVKGYKEPIATTKTKPDYSSAPNYRQLSLTSKRKMQDTISDQVHFGQPPKEQRKQHTTATVLRESVTE